MGVDGQSTAVASTVDTPLASGPSQKLKLTFSGSKEDVPNGTNSGAVSDEE